MKRTSKKQQNVSGNRVRVSHTVKRPEVAADEMRSHYDFDYSKSKPNRFASRFAEGSITVILDPDVASVFQTSENVNAFLRSAIAAMPPSEASKGSLRRSRAR
jgi:hypothetical protein